MLAPVDHGGDHRLRVLPRRGAIHCALRTDQGVMNQTVDNIKPVLSHGPPRPRVLPRDLPCHSVDKPPPTSRRPCQSGDQRSNQDLESQSGSPPRDQPLHPIYAPRFSLSVGAERSRHDGHSQPRCALAQLVVRSQGNEENASFLPPSPGGGSSTTFTDINAWSSSSRSTARSGTDCSW